MAADADRPNDVNGNLEIVMASALSNDSPKRQTAEEVDRIAAAIRGRLNGIRKDMVAIGRDLLRAKALLKHGQWIPWLNAEFGLSARTAENYMNVAERFGDKFESLSNLRLETAYKLAARSTPDAVVDEVLARASSGKRLNDSDAAAMLRTAERQRSTKPVPVAVANEAPPRPKPPVDPLNDWTTQAFDLLRAQIKDKARLKSLSVLLRRADIDGLVDKIDSYVAPAS